MRSLLVMVVVVAACGNDGKDGVQPKADASTADAFSDPYRDAPPTSTVEVTVSGRVTDQDQTGSKPVAGVTITAYRNADETAPLASTTSDINGDYTITVQTNGESIDGFLRATHSDYVDTYLYPPYPLMTDFANASIILLKPSTYDTLSLLGQANQAEGKGLIGLVVTNGTAPVGGAVVRATPMPTTPTRYNAPVGNLVLPSTTATSTYTDGVAYLFNVEVGPVTVGATHPTLTLEAHGVRVHPDVLTTTVIVPP